MAIESDVLVVGGGLAGATAALAAARTGAHVRLVSHKESTLRQASGLVDVLGYTPEGAGPLAEPLDALGELPEDHPYRRAGREAVEAGLALFDEVAGAAYEGSHTTANALVPTAGGRIKPTARYPASVAAGLASDDRDTLLVGFERLPDFDAPLAAARLSDRVPFAVRGVTVEFPVELGADPVVTRFAGLLDRDADADHGTGSVREVLAETVRDHLDGAARVGFPAVLGDDDPPEVRETLESALGAAVFEVPTGPPSLPGMRLADRLYDALDEGGVSIETGNPVVGFEASGEGGGDGDCIEHVQVKRTGTEVPYSADQYVLATGGLVGKGLDSDREGVREPVFDCYVAHPPDRYDWADAGAFGDHAFARFGVDPDAELRPLDADGGREFENLRAAGAVLGNYDFAAERSGSGVSLATGYRAGELAGERALEGHS